METRQWEQALRSHNSFLDALAQDAGAPAYPQTRQRMTDGPHPTDDMLYDYVEDDLEANQAAIIQAHIARCAVCADEVLRLRLMTDAVDADVIARAMPPARTSLLATVKTRLAEALLTWMPEGAGLALASAASTVGQKEEFPMPNGKITLECEWDDEAIWIEWHIDVPSSQEFRLRFINPDTQRLYYETNLRMIRDDEETFLSRDIGFRPTADRWAITIA